MENMFERAMHAPLGICNLLAVHAISFDGKKCPSTVLLESLWHLFLVGEACGDVGRTSCHQ